MDIGEVIADLARSVFRRRAFTAVQASQLVGRGLQPAIVEPVLSNHRSLVPVATDDLGQKWYALKSDLFRWFCHLNSRLAGAQVFRLSDERLARAMSSLRVEGQWHGISVEAIAWGEALGMVGQGREPKHYAFPLARVLSGMPGLTRKAAASALRQLEEGRVWETETAPILEACVRQSLSLCDRRTRGIVLRRTGLQTGERMTLQEAGSPWRLTRERTRQLEQRFWVRLKALAGEGRQQRRSLVMAMLCDFIAHQGRLVMPLTSATRHLRTFLARCSCVPVGEARELGFVVLGASAREVAALESRRYAANLLTDEAIAESLATKTLPGLNARDVATLAHATGAYRRRHLRRVQRVYLALRAIGRPAHYSRITEVHNTMFPERASSERNIHACLSQGELGVVWVGARGTFALREWGYERPSASLFDSVADIVERKYEETGRPVPYSVIVAEIGKVRPIVNASSLTFACHCNERLRRVEDNHFVPRGDDVGAPDEPSADELDRLLREFQKSSASDELGAEL